MQLFGGRMPRGICALRSRAKLARFQRPWLLPPGYAGFVGIKVAISSRPRSGTRNRGSREKNLHRPRTIVRAKVRVS